MALTSDQNIAVIFVEALFFGLYLCSFLGCIRWLIFADEGWRRRRDIHWSMLMVTLIIFSFLTTNIVLTLWRTMAQSVAQRSFPLAKLHLAWVDVVLCTTTNMIILLADAVLIHRLWMIYWHSYRVIVFPVLLWLGAFVCTILQIYWKTVQARGMHDVWEPVNMRIGPGAILTPFWGATMLLNMYATVMISFCIWDMVKKNEGVAAIRSLRFLMRTFIESGFLYLIVTTSHFIVWWTPSLYAIIVVAGMNTPMMAIAFNLIIIRTGAKKAELSMQDRMRPQESSMRFTGPTVANASEGSVTTAIIDSHAV